ncbi:hypothetical protein [Agrobacterium vitis]|uniref:Uncharacterized protein n=1 Tax=Agrobacterium vitis TaxID=373 RepID=A0AAE4W9X4_AGRVI|nr:hypothetical protein [Agrobacterium vitis]MCF1498785.1 hypothetical protein [Allorhizobium sp. Av2]MUZ56523.1 hypothetical protein [Agrobacterium vitis]MVA64340.1 hypothetical protein [Agrobacterium vitis]MVA85312.1 hypothetical protein [Agrobacterium vitis]
MIDATLTPLFERPLSARARAFLRKLKIHGSQLIVPDGPDRLLANDCRACGYVLIREDHKTVLLTGLGQAYLDRLMRAN